MDSVHTKEDLRKLSKAKFTLKIFKPDIYVKENIDAIKEGKDLKRFNTVEEFSQWLDLETK